VKTQTCVLLSFVAAFFLFFHVLIFFLRRKENHIWGKCDEWDHKVAGCELNSQYKCSAYISEGPAQRHGKTMKPTSAEVVPFLIDMIHINYNYMHTIDFYMYIICEM